LKCVAIAKFCFIIHIMGFLCTVFHVAGVLYLCIMLKWLKS
jgi:hypothetical protein